MFYPAIIIIMFFCLSGCSNRTHVKKEIDYNDGESSKERFFEQKQSTKPYVVFGKRYFPIQEVSEFQETGIASWYGKKFHGRPTASGEIYDMHSLTAAHKTLPLPTYVTVNNLENGKTILVKVNDRGPFVDGRIIDLSYAAADALDIVRQGTAAVRITIAGARVKTVKKKSIDNGWYVQLGAFREKQNAMNLVKKINAQLDRFQVEVVSTKDGWHKVITLFPWKNAIPAEIQDTLKALGVGDYSYVSKP